MGEVCEPCKDRGIESLATRIVAGTLMCSPCFEGKDPRPRPILGLGPAKPREQKWQHYNPVDVKRLKRLHRRGLTDSAIGRELGHADSVIRAARIRLGLRQNPWKRGRFPHLAFGDRRDQTIKV